MRMKLNSPEQESLTQKESKRLGLGEKKATLLQLNPLFLEPTYTIVPENKAMHPQVTFDPPH